MKPCTTISLAQLMQALRIAERHAPKNVEEWVMPIQDGEILTLVKDRNMNGAKHTGGWTLAHPMLVVPQ